jgi:plasmid stability protein
MANLTLTIDDEVLRRARIRALEQGTSVNALVREHLERYARDERRRAAVQELVELSRTSAGSSGVDGRTWTRDDLYDR